MRDFYSVIPPCVVNFQGGFRVFGVDTDRSKNKTFLDYSHTRKDLSLIYEKQVTELPEEAKKLIEEDINLSGVQAQMEGRSIKEDRDQRLKLTATQTGRMSGLKGKLFLTNRYII